MPRIKQLADQYRTKDFLHAMRIQMAVLEINQGDIAKALNLSEARTSVLLKNPEELTVERLRGLIQVCDMKPEQVLLFLGFSTKQSQESNKKG